LRRTLADVHGRHRTITQGQSEGSASVKRPGAAFGTKRPPVQIRPPRPRNMQVTSSPCDRASALRSADVRFWDALGAILSPILGVRFWEPILRPPPPCPNRNCLMAGRLAKGSGTAVRAHLSRGFAQRIVGRGRCHRRSPSWLSLSRRVRAAQCRRLVGPRKTPTRNAYHLRRPSILIKYRSPIRVIVPSALPRARTTREVEPSLLPGALLDPHAAALHRIAAASGVPCASRDVHPAQAARASRDLRWRGSPG